MARIVKEQAYAERRKAILAVAWQLVGTKGYEQMTIQDMLDALRISKGAFYHYFDSKQMLLEALVEGMQDEVEQLLIPIVHDPHLPALAKFQRFFDTASRWKIAQQPFVVALLRVWYTDDNAIVRQKVRASIVRRVAPLLTEVIRQGIQEGVLTTPFPDQAGAIILSLIQDFSDTFAALLLSAGPEHGDLPHIKHTVAAHTDALERVLGAPSGSLHVVDNQTLKEWIVLTSQEAMGRNAT